MRSPTNTRRQRSLNPLHKKHIAINKLRSSLLLLARPPVAQTGLGELRDVRGRCMGGREWLQSQGVGVGGGGWRALSRPPSTAPSLATGRLRTATAAGSHTLVRGGRQDPGAHSHGRMQQPAKEEQLVVASGRPACCTDLCSVWPVGAGTSVGGVGGWGYTTHYLVRPTPGTSPLWWRGCVMYTGEEHSSVPSSYILL